MGSISCSCSIVCIWSMTQMSCRSTLKTTFLPYFQNNLLKGAMSSFGEEIQNQIYWFFSMTEKTSWFQLKTKSSEHCLKLEKWQGPPRSVTKEWKSERMKEFLYFICLGVNIISQWRTFSSDWNNAHLCYDNLKYIGQQEVCVLRTAPPWEYRSHDSAILIIVRIPTYTEMHTDTNTSCINAVMWEWGEDHWRWLALIFSRGLYHTVQGAIQRVN